MPHLPINYANTIIYKIVCNDLNITECYVGHTTDFAVRKYMHKYTCSYEKGKDYNAKLYSTIRENGGWKNYSMIEIEKYPCAVANEARAKEREWFESLSARLNMLYPQRNQGERYQANRERILAKVRAYAYGHKQEISDRGKLNRVIHKAEIKERRSKKFICECGKEILHDHKSRHLRTESHMQLVSTTNSPSV